MCIAKNSKNLYKTSKAYISKTEPVKKPKLTKSVKADLIFPVINEMLAQGKHVRLTVTGFSMYPFLRENTDSVELVKRGFEELCKGDIALIRRVNGQYILHRVLRKTHDAFYLVGDAQQWIEGPLNPGQLVAAASAVYREDHRIPCSNWIWRILCCLWLWALPGRKMLISMIEKLREIKKLGKIRKI